MPLAEKVVYAIAAISLSPDFVFPKAFAFICCFLFTFLQSEIDFYSQFQAMEISGNQLAAEMSIGWVQIYSVVEKTEN